MPRDRKGLVRRSGGQAKDPKIYFIIAAEGSETERRYFEMVKSFLATTGLDRLVKVESLERPETRSHTGKTVNDTSSAPRKVVDLLDSYRKQYIVKEGDQLWCLVDRDNWKEKQFSEVDRLCRQKGYEFCLTNPCFEFWLLLHLCDFVCLTLDEKQMIFKNKRLSPGNRTYVESQVNERIQAFGQGGFQKNAVRPAFMPLIPLAVQRAFALRLEEQHWKMDSFCTRIHILLQRILKLSPPDYKLPI